MSRRHDIQEATGRIEYLSGRGTVEAWGVGAPINGATGFAPGCLWHNVTGGANTSAYLNEGTFTSATWVPILTGGTTGDDTFATLTVTTLLRGGTTGLTINGAVSGSNTIGLGQSTDSIYLGSSSPGLGTDSSALGKATPGNTTVGMSLGSGGAVSATFNSTGNFGSTAYTYSGLINILKQEGLIKA